MSTRRWPRFTIRRLMVAIAASSPPFMILRGDELGEIIFGLWLIASCVTILGYKLASGAIAREEADGGKLSVWQKAGIVLNSSLVALVVIGTADLAFFAVYEMRLTVLQGRRSHSSYHLQIQWWIVAEALALALGLSFCFRFVLRRLKMLPPSNVALPSSPIVTKAEESDEI